LFWSGKQTGKPTVQCSVGQADRQADRQAGKEDRQVGRAAQGKADRQYRAG